MRAEQHHRELRDLAGLDQRHCLEQLVKRAEAAGEDNVPDAVLDEHRLANEEITEVDQRVDVGIGPLLEREFDVAPDRMPAPLLRALVGGLHDARSRPGHDRKSILGQELRRFRRRRVVGIAWLGARRAEERHPLLDARQLVEPLDDLAHDAHHAPGVGAREIVAPLGREVEQLLVLRHQGRHVTNGIVDAPLLLHALRSRGPLTRRRASRRHVAGIVPFAHAFQLGVFSAPAQLRIDRLPTRAARRLLLRFRHGRLRPGMWRVVRMPDHGRHLVRAANSAVYFLR